MKQWDLDETITKVLKTEVAEITVDDRIKRNINQLLANSQYKEERRMKYVSIKKLSVAGIAVALLSASMIFASGQVTSLVSTSNLFMRCKDYSKLSKQEEKLGYNVEVIESFSNGYNFKEMEVGKVKGLDDLGNTVEIYKELDVQYVHKSGKQISIHMNQRNVGRGFRTPVQTLKCGETTLYYYRDTYKFVPVDYVLTKEDKINLEREDYEISSGSEKVELSIMSSVEWEKDGVRYHLLAIDTDMTSNEMLNMASEIIQQLHL